MRSPRMLLQKFKQLMIEARGLVVMYELERLAVIFGGDQKMACRFLISLWVALAPRRC